MANKKPTLQILDLDSLNVFEILIVRLLSNYRIVIISSILGLILTLFNNPFLRAVGWVTYINGSLAMILVFAIFKRMPWLLLIGLTLLFNLATLIDSLT